MYIMSDLACWDEACAHLTVRRHFPCQSEARASCCSGFREMLLLGPTWHWQGVLELQYPCPNLTSCQSYRPADREKKWCKCTDAALLATSGKRIQHGGKSDGWAAIQDFRVEISMLIPGLPMMHRCAYCTHYKCKGRIKHAYRGSPRTHYPPPVHL